jgi:hypothetical protein
VRLRNLITQQRQDWDQLMAANEAAAAANHKACRTRRPSDVAASQQATETWRQQYDRWTTHR